MEFNKDILHYCVRGVPQGTTERYGLTALKVLTKYFKIESTIMYDNPNRVYSIIQFARDKNEYISVGDVSLNDLKEVSPEEYVSILTGNKFNLHWYENIGSTITMGWSYGDCRRGYNFGFDTNRANMHSGEEFTIDEVRTYDLTSKEALWHNGDNRIYHIKELDHWFPSAVFVPLLDTVPIKELSLTSISIKELVF